MQCIYHHAGGSYALQRTRITPAAAKSVRLTDSQDVARTAQRAVVLGGPSRWFLHQPHNFSLTLQRARLAQGRARTVSQEVAVHAAIGLVS